MKTNQERAGSRLRSLSCFFPALNEAAHLPGLLDEAVDTLPSFADAFEVIVVDDGSTDRTAEIVREYASRHPEVRLVSHPRNLGYGRAILTGLQESTKEAVFLTDADRQFRIVDIERLLPAFKEADVVAGYRLKRMDPRGRLVVAKIYHFLLQKMFGVRFHDVDCAFKLIRREALDAVLGELPRSGGAFISPELLIRTQMAGFRVVEVGVPHYPRQAGRAKGVGVKVVARTIWEMAWLRVRLKRRGDAKARVRRSN